VGAYAEHAVAPLTLAGWVAWSGGDESGARVALGRALELDPGYVFARLLHGACNSGLDPEPLRQCLRRQRAARGLGTAAARG
jgi:ABC-type polar amino acid transport system ATPase subunit